MSFFQKDVYVKRKKKEDYVYEKRGICLGVYTVKKTGKIKYLFCSIDDDKTVVLPVNAIDFLANNGIYLKNLRSAVPNQCARLTPFLPVYSALGKYMGRLNGIESKNLTVTKLLVGENKYPALSVVAVSDALILEQLNYPVGAWSKTEDGNVTKKLLKDKIRQGELIRFTLSLAPFQLES